MNKATVLLGEAYRRAPEASACKPGPDDSPSRFAMALMALLEEEGATCEMRLSNIEYKTMRDRAPAARWYRAVFRLSDGSVMAVHDSGAEIAMNDSHVLRYPNQQFAGVWDGQDPHALERALAMGVARIPNAEARTDEIAKEMSIPRTNRSSERHPLNTVAAVIAVDAHNNAVVATPFGIEFVPSNADDSRAILEHCNACARRMHDELGIPEEEVLAEINPQVLLYQDAIRAYDEAERLNVGQVMQEFTPRA